MHKFGPELLRGFKYTTHKDKTHQVLEGIDIFLTPPLFFKHCG